MDELKEMNDEIFEEELKFIRSSDVGKGEEGRSLASDMYNGVKKHMLECQHPEMNNDLPALKHRAQWLNDVIMQVSPGVEVIPFFSDIPTPPETHTGTTATPRHSASPLTST